MAPEARVQCYTGLSYSIAEPVDEPLILGDSMVLFHVDGAKPFKPLLDKGDTLNAAFLPLDAKTLLVGTTHGFEVKQRGLREAIARCSLEYFITTDKSNANDLLKEQIGIDAAPLTKEELEEIVLKCIVNHIPIR